MKIERISKAIWEIDGKRYDGRKAVVGMKNLKGIRSALYHHITYINPLENHSRVIAHMTRIYNRNQVVCEVLDQQQAFIMEYKCN